MYDFLDSIPKAPRQMTSNLPYLVGKKKLGFLFKKTWINILTKSDIVYCAIIQSADMEKLENGKTGYSGLAIYIYTLEKKYVKDAIFLKKIADKMRKIRFKQGDLTESELKVSTILNNTSTPMHNFKIPLELTNGIICYLDTDYLNTNYFENDYVPQVFPILLGKKDNNTHFHQKINVKKFKQLSNK